MWRVYEFHKIREYASIDYCIKVLFNGFNYRQSNLKFIFFPLTAIFFSFAYIFTDIFNF